MYKLRRHIYRNARNELGMCLGIGNFTEKKFLGQMGKGGVPPPP